MSIFIENIPEYINFPITDTSGVIKLRIHQTTQEKSAHITDTKQKANTISISYDMIDEVVETLNDCKKIIEQYNKKHESNET